MGRACVGSRKSGFGLPSLLAISLIGFVGLVIKCHSHGCTMASAHSFAVKPLAIFGISGFQVFIDGSVADFCCF